MNAQSKLAAKGVLAILETGQWRTVKRHHAETKAENARHGLTDEARVDVKICAHPALESIGKLVSEARIAHYRLALPTATDGLRFLPGARQFEHSKLLSDYAARFDGLVADFLQDYNLVRASAPARLNGLYVAAHWPDVAVVRNAFKFQTRYLPVATTGWEEWLDESASVAEADLRERLAEAIRRVAQRLAVPAGDKGGRFWDSLVTNLQDLLSLVPDLNLRDDPTLASLASAAQDLTKHAPDTLREDPVARSETAARAAEIASLFKL